MKITLSNRINSLATLGRTCLSGTHLNREVLLKISDGKVESIHWKVKNSPLERAVAESYSHLVENKPFWSFWSISNRELENFLKDSNDEAPFPESFVSEFNHLILEFHLIFKKGLLDLILAKQAELSLEKIRKDDLLTLLEGLKQHYDRILCPILGTKSPILGLFQWDNPLLFFTVTQEKDPVLPQLFSLLEEVYLLTFQLSPLKLVAVEGKTI